MMSHTGQPARTSAWRTPETRAETGLRFALDFAVCPDRADEAWRAGSVAGKSQRRRPPRVQLAATDRRRFSDFARTIRLGWKQFPEPRGALWRPRGPDWSQDASARC